MRNGERCSRLPATIRCPFTPRFGRLGALTERDAAGRLPAGGVFARYVQTELC